jgi:hypothetical protein
MTPDEFKSIIEAMHSGMAIQVFNYTTGEWGRITNTKLINVEHKYRIAPSALKVEGRITGFVVVDNMGQFRCGANNWDTLARHSNFKRWLARGYRIINVQEIK